MRHLSSTRLAAAVMSVAALTAGLAACGTEETPCVLETVSVQPERADARLASVERAVGMTMRVRS